MLDGRKQTLKQRTLYEMLFDVYTGVFFDVDELISWTEFQLFVDILQNKIGLKNIIYAGYSNVKEIAAKFKIDYLPATDKRLSLHIWSPNMKFNKVDFKQELLRYKPTIFDKQIYSQGMQKFRVIFCSKDVLNDKKCSNVNIIYLGKHQTFDIKKIQEHGIDVRWMFVQFYDSRAKEFPYVECVKEFLYAGFLKLKTY